MNRTIKLGAVLSLLATLGFALTASASTTTGSTNSHGDPDPRTVHVIEHATTDTQVPSSPDQTGSVLTFHNDVYDKADAKKVGTDRGDCVRIDPAAGTWECRWTTFLSGGQITVEGPFNDTSNTALSITGGTGGYRNARGQMQLLSRVLPDKSQEYDFIFQLSE
jgi:allene oxide cyclase